MGRKLRQTVDKCTGASTTVSGSQCSKRGEAGKQAVTAPFSAVSLQPDSPEGDIVQRLHSSPRGRLGKDKKNVAVSRSIQSNKRQESRRQEQKRRRIRQRQNNRKGNHGSTAPYGPPERQTRAFKEAGLPSKGLWKLSHRNKAER